MSCSVATAAVNFGTYDPTALLPVTNNGSVSVRCTCSGTLDCVAFTYSLGLQPGASGSTATRYMIAAGLSTTLQYNLYQDPAYATVWGTGSAAQSELYTVALFGNAQTTFVYGKAPAKQNVKAANYSDAPGVTISF